MEFNTIDDEFEDALSFCDLPLSDQSFESDFSSSSTLDNFFEFSTSSSSPLHQNSVAHSIIFCGKRISPKSELAADYYLTNNGSIKKPAINHSSPSLPQRGKNLRSQSTSGKKQRVMIGLAKIPSKMEISDLRERQNWKISIPPPPMLPAAVKRGESAVVSGKGSGGRKSRSWGPKYTSLRQPDSKSVNHGCLNPHPFGFTSIIPSHWGALCNDSLC